MKKFNFKSYFAGVISTVLVIALILSVGAATITKTLNATYKDIKISVNGTAIIPKDATGKTIEPFIVDGSTYLPVRAVADAVGYDVEWDGVTSTVKLTNKSNSQPKDEPKKEVVEGSLKTAKEIQDYLTENYSKVPSTIADLPKVTFRVVENESTFNLYDFKIEVLWWTYDSNLNSLYQVYTNVINSIKYTDEQKETLKNEMKSYQEKLAKDLIAKLPDKKLIGCFYYGYYKYEYIKEDWTVVQAYGWVNYKSDTYAPFYEDTYIDVFKWETFKERSPYPYK